MYSSLRRVGLLAVFATVFAVGAAPAQTRAQTPNAAPRTAGAAAPQAAEYVLGPGDVIRINVFQSPELSLETRLSESGSVSYPLLGNVRLGGLAVPEAEKRIADGLRSGNIVKQPQVSIMVVQVRGNQASVLGQVNRPGRYPLEQASVRLSDLIATAGGIAGTGTDIVTVVGQRAGKPYRTQVDFPNIFGGGANDIAIENGDVIYVDRQPMVYIYGEVQRPGAVRLERGMTVMQALATGGGLTQRGTEKGIRVNRRDSGGKVQVLQPGMDETLRDGDVVYVRESLF
jgi:polysaccharide export outer membrane protein